MNSPTWNKITSNHQPSASLHPLPTLEHQLFTEKALTQVVLQSVSDAVITVDGQGRIRHLNAVAETLTGWKQAEISTFPVSQVFKVAQAAAHTPSGHWLQSLLGNSFQSVAIDPFSQPVPTQMTALLINRQGDACAIDHTVTPVRDRRGRVQGAVIVFRSASAPDPQPQQPACPATHDPLTGLVNRHSFEQILSQALLSAQQNHQQHVLCHFNLDQFKVINDTCGHAAGDQMLRQIIPLLQHPVRISDVLARLEGDDFCLLLRQCTLDHAKVIVEQIRQRVHDFRLTWANQTLSVGVSIGLVAIHYNSPNVSSLLSAADAACYAAKARGRNRIHTYHLDDIDLIQRRGSQRWSLRIKQALDENRFRLYGQAIVPACQDATGQCCEVLLRMVDENNQVVTAANFIPAAERYNLMPEIDRWVIRQFLADHFNPPQIAPTGSAQPSPYMINLSGASIGDEQFLAFLQKQFQQYPFAARQICFEITETAAISNLKQATRFIAAMKELGCQFALDDFGSGMSSFAYLKALPVDYLKIDGHFIRDMLTDPATRAIVESINTIGHVMGLKTIAESVGDLTTRLQLHKMGVDFVQGFGIALPCSLTYEH